jgi:hypothetical protein
MPEKPKRILQEVDVYFISLVDAGANMKSIIWKSETADEKFNLEKTIEIIKADEEQ